MKLSTISLAILYLSVSQSMLYRPRHTVQRPRRSGKVDTSAVRAYLKGKEKPVTLVEACESGNSVKALALLQETDYSTEDFNKAFWHACMSGMTEVASELVKNHGVDPSIHGNVVLESAIRFELVDTVKFLLTDARVRSIPVERMYFRRAVFDGNEDMSLALLSHPSIDPSIGRNLALYMAVQKHMPNLFDRLMLDSRVTSKPEDMFRSIIEAYDKNSNAELQRMADVLNEEHKRKLMNESFDGALALLSLRSTDPMLIDWKSQSRIHDELSEDHLRTEESGFLHDAIMFHLIQDFVDFDGDMGRMIFKWDTIAAAFGVLSLLFGSLYSDTEACKELCMTFLEDQDTEDLANRGFDFSGLQKITASPSSSSASSEAFESNLMDDSTEDMSSEVTDDDDDVDEEIRKLEIEEAELARLEAELEESA